MRCSPLSVPSSIRPSGDRQHTCSHGEETQDDLTIACQLIVIVVCKSRHNIMQSSSPPVKLEVCHLPEYYSYKEKGNNFSIPVAVQQAIHVYIRPIVKFQIS